jgi:hypothetical protein
MKIILSRKGFDSSNGGVPSPILPGGRLISLPIPSRQDKRLLGSLSLPRIDLAKVASDLTNGNINARTSIHLDPDLNPGIVARSCGWRPAFGQSKAAQRHLENQGVGLGDLFLFYGWFRQVEIINGTFRFARNAPDLHVIYGWLQVGEAWYISEARAQLLAKHPALAGHPHLASREKYSDPSHNLNTLYVGADHLLLDGQRKLHKWGAGVFEKLADCRTLTKTGMTRRFWRLPKWMMPRGSRRPLSYHKSSGAWTLCDDHAVLRSACIGQEFVLDCDHYPEALAWAYKMIANEHKR